MWTFCCEYNIDINQFYLKFIQNEICHDVNFDVITITCRSAISDDSVGPINNSSILNDTIGTFPVKDRKNILLKKNP